MNYPIWHIPGLGGSWLIGIIAIIHIFISHFAVGGGIFFAITEQVAFKNKNNRLYEFLKQHSKFFLLLTTVAGAVTGVAIWWAISLVSPDGTHTLIQNYTLGWACEYLFFVAELATIFVYYYTWDKVSREQHLLLARLYAVFSVMTLVIINGILTFMLTPGGWLESGYWGHGFFNPTYWPSLIIRLVMMMALAGIYALVNCARLPKEKNEDLDFRSYMLRYSSKWFLPIFVLGPICVYWFAHNLPVEVTENIFNGIQSSGIGNFSILARAFYLSLILSGTILIYVFVGPYLNPRGFSFTNAVMFMCCAFLVTGIGEWTREMLRKPFVVYDYMYSNGIIKSQIPKLQSKPWLEQAKWLPPNLNKHQPLITPENALKAGEVMFKQQCMSCHTIGGYRDMRKLIGERDLASVEAFLQTIKQTDTKQNPYLNIMPPVIGSEDELKALSLYLHSIAH